MNNDAKDLTGPCSLPLRSNNTETFSDSPTDILAKEGVLHSFAAVLLGILCLVATSTNSHAQGTISGYQAPAFRLTQPDHISNNLDSTLANPKLQGLLESSTHDQLGVVSFDIFVTDRNNQVYERIPSSSGVVAATTVTVDSYEDVIEALREQGLYIDGDSTELFFQINSFNHQDDIGEQQEVVIPKFYWNSETLRNKLKEDNQMVVFLNQSTKAETLQEIDSFKIEFGEFDNWPESLTTTKGSFAEQIRVLTSNINEWKTAIEFREMPLNEGVLRQLQSELTFLTRALNALRKGDYLDERELDLIDIVLGDIILRTELLLNSSRNNKKLNFGIKTKVTVLDQTVTQNNDSNNPPEKHGLVVYYASPIAMQSFKRLEVSSPAEGTVAFGTYCYWARDASYQLVTEVAAKGPPTIREKDGRPHDVRLRFVGHDLAKKRQDSGIPNLCSISS